MKLIEALQIIGRARALDRPLRPVHLLSGFTPLHLQTFVHATLQERDPQRRVELHVGLFGDLIGNVSRSAEQGATEAVIVIEWSDLDPRLGWRAAGGWGSAQLADIVATAKGSLTRLERSIEGLSLQGATIVVSAPTLPLPPVSFTPGWTSSEFELDLLLAIGSSMRRLATGSRVRIVNSRRLDHDSPLDARHDVRAEISSGFPYTQSHARALATLIVDNLKSKSTKKGLITDLDDTLWHGILGDVGVEGIACSLEAHAHVHALYQQLLASLADAGALLAIASKNEADIVAIALEREEHLVRTRHFFPINASWQPKSESVAQILQAWNVGAESVVFVDDSPIELAEVQARFPDVECFLFPKDDPAAVVSLLSTLRDMFGKYQLLDEDKLRLESLRSTREVSVASQGTTDTEAFLSGLDAKITFEISQDAADARAFELVNKTNQFNLNGVRYSEAEWHAALSASESFLLTAAYEDKFGRLGKIAVILARKRADEVLVASWVLSCRAFSRRIEHQCVQLLFDYFAVSRLVLDFQSTDRNGPTREFVARWNTGVAGEPIIIERAAFEATGERMYHSVTLNTGALDRA
jgi:FkbH-like protein